MATLLDHIILNVNDPVVSTDFYVAILGFTHEGKDGPFTVIRVSNTLTLQLSPWGTKGGEHLAFAVTRTEFEEIFARIRLMQLGIKRPRR
jgi:hypothetical protein